VRACKFNAALTASWQAQVKLLTALGNNQAAAQARFEFDRIQAMPKHLIAVTDLLSEGKIVKAENLCRKFLQHAPENVEAMRLLAEIGQRLGALDEAEFLLESAVLFEPNNDKVRIDYIQVLRKRQRFSLALNEAKKLLDQAPNNPQFQSVYAIELMQTGDYDTALEYFDKVLTILPNDAITLTSRGHALKTLGQYQQAVEAYQTALASRPQHGEAYYSLSNLKTYKFSDAEIALMLQQEKNLEHSMMERVHVYFALGKAYEDRKEYSKSFEYYELGNSLKRNSSGYDADKMSAELMAQRNNCTPALFTAHRGRGCSAPDPIFIVGLPRSGSTMLEQILSSHSQVDGTLELPNILSMAQKLRKQGKTEDEHGYPQNLAQLSSDELKTMGEKFITDTEIHRQGAAFFIDKMPNNFRHIGLIKLILPNAKIIDARRHPMACCFSNYKQLFAEGQEFSYDLNDIAQYYKDYVELMAHWDTVLPGQVLRVNYEQVVDDLETQVRRLLEFCGLPFESACLSFHETKRSVRTASSEQVRQPIYRSGLEQWSNYGAELTGLQQQLQELNNNYL
jgi:tetratricopeptide (TPR) repeat protein